MDAHHRNGHSKCVLFEPVGLYLTQRIDEVIVQAKVAIGVGAERSHEVQTSLQRQVDGVPIDRRKVLDSEIHFLVVWPLIKVRLSCRSTRRMAIPDDDGIACKQFLPAGVRVVIGFEVLVQQGGDEIDAKQTHRVDFVHRPALNQ